MTRKPLFGPKEALPFGMLHLGVCLTAAALAGPRALALGIIVSFLAALRYLGMALVARNLASRSLVLVAALSLWFSALVALAVALYVTGSQAPGLLIWGAAAALAGPVSVFLSTLARGLAGLIFHREEASA